MSVVTVIWQECMV